MFRLHMSCFHSFATLLLLFSIEVYAFTKLLPNRGVADKLGENLLLFGGIFARSVHLYVQKMLNS